MEYLMMRELAGLTFADNYMESESIFSDNYLGVDIDRTDGVIFRDSVIIGESGSYRQLKARQKGVGNVCRNKRIIGI